MAHDPVNAERQATELLDRVVRRIYRAGLDLRVTAGAENAPFDVNAVLAELDKVLIDIRTTVLSWSMAPSQRNETQGRPRSTAPDNDNSTFGRGTEQTDGVGDTTVAHLRAIAEALETLQGIEQANHSANWVATNEASHRIHSVIVLLQKNA